MDMHSRNICVVGLGYIGLPTASFLATKGHTVLGVDVDEGVVQTISKGAIHFKEPDLDLLVRSAVHSGNLTAALEPAEADVFIISVPTPLADGHAPDLSHIEAATRAIAPHIQRGALVILESTSPVGTTERVDELLTELRPDLVSDEERTFFVAHCPERVLPGNILRELVENDRVVGGVDTASTQRAVEFYADFVNGEVLATDARTAEMCKLVENSYRDVNIAFANELSMIAHPLNINVWELIRLANRHPRVDILHPGPGVGGHCLALDPWFVVASAPEESRIIRTARMVNDRKAAWVCKRVLARAERFRNPVIACLGLTYKANVGDLRESPALAITRTLRQRVDGEILACDPHVRGFDEFPISPLNEALGRADIVVALVAHRQFRTIDPQLLQDRVLIDACGIFP